MTAKWEQSTVEPSCEADSHRLAALRAGARRLIEVQRSRIRIIEATLSEQAATLLELASRQEASAAEQREVLAEERDRLSQERAVSVEAQLQAEKLLDEARDGLKQTLERQSELRAQLSESGLALEETKSALEEQNTALEQSNRALEEKKTELEERTAELVVARGNKESAVDSGEVDSLMVEIERLESERVSLQDQLEQVVEAAAANKAEESAVLRQRFEAAVEELRELKTKNEELVAANKALSSRPAASDATIAVPSGAFDWETQKLALMKQMEDEFDESDSGQANNRLTVEGAIRITDEVVAEKDLEIEELKELLANQSANLGDVAVGAAAIADMLDQDELIRDERENLRRQQEEWREKLRRAEVEISVERAKFARERTELDERVRNFEKQQSNATSREPREQDGKAPRGNWLSRLGLKDET